MSHDDDNRGASDTHLNTRPRADSRPDLEIPTIVISDLSSHLLLPPPLVSEEPVPSSPEVINYFPSQLSPDQGLLSPSSIVRQGRTSVDAPGSLTGSSWGSDATHVPASPTSSIHSVPSVSFAQPSIPALRDNNPNANSSPPGAHSPTITLEITARQAPGFLRSTANILFSSWLNLLLLCIPVSFVLHFIWGEDPTDAHLAVIFVFSCLSTVPLAKLLMFVTDDLSLRVEESQIGFINITVGNAVEFAIWVASVRKCKLEMVQSLMIGGLLVRLLLMPGICFVAGGIWYSEQTFSSDLWSTETFVLFAPSIVSLLSVFSVPAPQGDTEDAQWNFILALSISRWLSIISSFIYVCYAIFRLGTHTWLYGGGHTKKPSKKTIGDIEESGGEVVAIRVAHTSNDQSTMRGTTTNEDIDNTTLQQPADPTTVLGTDAIRAENVSAVHLEESKKTPKMGLMPASIFLVVIAILVPATAESLVSSFDGLISYTRISEEALATVVLPILSKVVECIAAMKEATEDRLDRSLDDAFGSGNQVATLLIPLTVILAWAIGKPLVLSDPFQSITLFIVVIVVNFLVSSGKSSWLKGVAVVCLYAIIAVVFGSSPNTYV